MNRPKLLYVSINDGSDTRINKEIKSLATHFDIYYLGIGKSKEKSFIENYCFSFNMVNGHHKNTAALFKYYLVFIKTFFSNSFESIHVINEQLILLFYPFLITVKDRVVLDIFDSIFLRANRKLEILKKLVYNLPQAIIVTDDNRKSLLPQEFQSKVVVVENFPYEFKNPVAKISQRNELILFYNGSMSKIRGTEIVQNMLAIETQLKVKMAGWIYDESTRQLSEHPQVEYLGIITQQESMKVATQCDYILSLYEPVNENNINASPNKIYDAIQAKTPVVINKEVKVASFVKENNIGYILESFSDTSYRQIIQDLIQLKESYNFNGDLQKRYTWEAVEGKLLEIYTR